jgi:hypothetical protein
MLFENLLAGAGTIFSIAPSRDKRLAKILNRSDSEAIASDWQTVGGDLYSAIDKYKQNIDGKKEKQQEQSNAQ